MRFETTGKFVNVFVRLILGKKRVDGFTRSRRESGIRYEFNLKVVSVKEFRMEIEILASVYCRKLELTDLSGHDGKVMSDINFSFSPYYRPLSADTDFLHELLLNSRLL